MEIIVTDLTRFKKNNDVCIAGINLDTGECIRPYPYIKKSRCKELKILPGARLDGKFSFINPSNKPHIEDSNYSDLMFNGPCTSIDFKKALTLSLYQNAATGFGVNIPAGCKKFEVASPPVRSIITLSILPSIVSVVENQYDANNLRLHITDASGFRFSFLSITDLGFYESTLALHRQGRLADINTFLRSQKEVYVRLGLSREHEGAYWIQANGIYTFPDFHKGLRCYS